MATKISNAAMFGLSPENMSSHEHLPLELDSSFLNTSTVIALCVFFALLCACIIIGHLLEENRWANESITALLLGLCAGGVVLLVRKGESSHLLKFSEDLFFLYLLPPIIFNAGFQVKKKRFFKNFSTILLFGIFGTVISFCIISLGVFWIFRKIGVKSLSLKDHLAIGAIMSATDSVCTLQVLSQDETPFLYSIVFGEGVVNDATSIVLFNSVQTLDFHNIDGLTVLKLIGTFLYLLFTSTALGIAVGLLSAFIIKTLYFGRHSTDREFALMILMAYLSYLLAEVLTIIFKCFLEKERDVKSDCDELISSRCKLQSKNRKEQRACTTWITSKSEWDSDSFLLRHCNVALHMAQCYRKLTDNNQKLWFV
ncbi:hypothetical protein NC652_030736 [Populus alba x Populus x berolinensis]|nr:hypothetical protein NC652_030736 [Populus alba x Populus x berolinensis]